MKYLLDTNICIALIKKHDVSLKRKFAAHSITDFALCSIVKAELLYGARKSQNVAANIKSLEYFFNQFESLPFDDSAIEEYGTIRSILAKEGAIIGPNDLIIASIALAHNLTLLTRNQREFLRVPSLKTEGW